MNKAKNVSFAAMVALLIYFVGSHIISFLCSIFESVLLSCSDAYIALQKKKGARYIPLLEELKTEIDRPLAAILTLNTISHTIGAAGVGASIVELFGNQYLAVGSAVLTLTMLYWTEMLPKTVGALYWKTLIPWCVKPINWLIFLTYPFVVSFNLFARLFNRNKKALKITEDDIRVALEVGTKAGVIEANEQDMVENIFRLGDRRVGVLMSPRVDIEWLDIGDSIESIRAKILGSKHHHFPICEGDMDKVSGIVHARDLLANVWLGKKIDLKRLASPPLFVNELQPVFELMDLFREHHQKIALVIDEYGSIQGMITLGDVMNAIIKDVEEERAEPILSVDQNSWVVDGHLPIDEFKEFFHLEELPEEEHFRYRTLSGLCMAQLGQIPKRGDIFEIGIYHFEILLVKKKRVEKILVVKRVGR